MTVHILIGTTSGNTEYLAESLSDQLNQQQRPTQLHDQPNINEIPSSHATWLVCVATHGAGEFAESIDQFMHDLATQQPNLQSVRAAIVSIGDSSYDTFCQAGIETERLLIQLGATLICDRLEIDMLVDSDPEATANAWLTSHIDRF